MDNSFSIMEDGKAFLKPSDHDAFLAELRKISESDANIIHEFEELLIKAADVLREVVLETPPNLCGGLPDLWRAGKVANRIRKLNLKEQRFLVKMMTMSVGEFLNEWFESDILKGNLASVAAVGSMRSPYAPGSAYVLLHHYFGEVNGDKGAWGHAIGGMGSITQAMAKSAREKGVDIQVNAPVKQVIVENGVVRGVELVSGEKITARVVAANVNPKLLFQQLIAPEHLDDDFSKQIDNYRCCSGTFRMNVALKELPKFTCLQHLPNPEIFIKGGCNFSPSLQFLENAYQDALKIGWTQKPMMETYYPSLIDDTLAPKGQHVMSLFCQHFNPELPNGENWDDIKESVADGIIDFINGYAPNFKESILGRQVLSPKDLEREFGLIGGDIFHGTLDLDQVYSMRPVAGFADYRMPLKNLYLCGSGAHPGGGVSGCPGRNAAHEMIKDLKKKIA
jgi:phytoene dehydrogenase-like protein